MSSDCEFTPARSFGALEGKKKHGVAPWLVQQWRPVFPPLRFTASPHVAAMPSSLPVSYLSVSCESTASYWQKGFV